MKTWNVTPLKGLNKISFGMKRDEVRNAMNTSYRSFKKTKFSSKATDDFGGLHAYYDADDRLEAVELFGDFKLILGERSALSSDFKELLEMLGSFEKDGDYYTNKSLSIGIFAPEGMVESVLFGVDGYYSD